MRNALLWASTDEWVANRLPRYRFVRRAVRRFMPGELLEDALAEAEALRSSGAATIVTKLGENVTAPEDADEVASEYELAYTEIASRGLDSQISVKLTQLGLDLDRGLALRHCEHLAAVAARSGKLLWVDMESSAYTQTTVDVYRTLKERHSNVGLALQSYLHRTKDDLESLLELSPAIRFVKGAYAEPADVAFPNKRDVDEAYFAHAERLLGVIAAGGGGFAAFGTHDPVLMRRLDARVRELEIPPERYEFEMLYGIGLGEQNRLLAANTPLRVLISYGDAWFPWYMRRLAERPANVWFVARSMFR